jgi:2-polyprenyl-3-methyl-5-hydroxy-6-metoxy-1,4-benzoquinol methylase
MQKQRWEKEYAGLDNLPSSRTSAPSRALLEFLQTHGEVKGRALDVGAGKGRNSIYLAQQGFSVLGIELAGNAVQAAKEQVKELSLLDKVEIVERSAHQHVRAKDGEFVLVLDMMTMHLLDTAERSAYAKEVERVLSPGGYFVFYTIAADSPAAQNLFVTSPGPEPNSYVIPQTGMVETAFDEQGLKQMFPNFAVERLEKITEMTPAFGDKYERVYYSGVMRKPA